MLGYLNYLRDGIIVMSAAAINVSTSISVIPNYIGVPLYPSFSYNSYQTEESYYD